MRKPFFISTAIDYPSSYPHIGHAYEKIAADVIARFKRLQGFNVYFSTGTDEHGLKIQRCAEKEGKKPVEFVNEMAQHFKKMCKKLNISYNDFIRTTEERHIKVCQEVFKKLWEKKEIYKGRYKGLYCIECETFYTKRDLVNGKCPVHKKEPEIVDEENYFFKMSKYRDKIIEHIEKNEDFIVPESRRKEILSRLKEPLNDLSVSRTSFKWGITVPINEKHVQYVWLDALLNYITTLGYLNGEKFKKFWPADIHLIGKDIIWHHVVVWSSILMAIGLKLPKKILVHGFITINGEKISKDLGNVIDPLYLVEKYSLDALRYYLFREIAFGEDGDFSEDKLKARFNNELVANIGNFIHRTLTFIWSKFEGIVPEAEEYEEIDKEFEEKIKTIAYEVEKELENVKLDKALGKIVEFSNFCNQYFQKKEPWKDLKKAKTCLYLSINAVRNLAILLEPFLPYSAEKLWKLLNLETSVHEQNWDSTSKLQIKSDHRINKPEILFRKIEEKKI